MPRDNEWMLEICFLHAFNMMVNLKHHIQLASVVKPLCVMSSQKADKEPTILIEVE